MSRPTVVPGRCARLAASSPWRQALRHPAHRPDRRHPLVTPIPPALTLPGPYAAVVLDLDGLLVRTEDHWWQAKEVLFARHDVQFAPADHLAVLGTSETYTASYFVTRFGADPSQGDQILGEYLAIAAELFADGVEPNVGAGELLARLGGRVPLGLATNTRRPLVERVLAATGFSDSFDAIATGDEAAPKPAPDLYLLACSRLGVEPGDAVALEDSPTGVAAAKAAGMTCIGVPSHPDAPLPAADSVVASLLELL